MCGRYTIAHTTDEIVERFHVVTSLEQIGNQAPPPSIKPSYNVAPTDAVPIILARKSEAGEIYSVLEQVQWGLTPYWQKERKAKPLINIRAETLLENSSSSFRNLFARQRCIIPADSFYEWKKEGSRKLPLRICLKDKQLFGLAGVYDDWRTPDGKLMRSCAIITVDNNELLNSIHNRMPAVLPPHLEALWLDPNVKEPAVLAKALIPYPAELMQMYEVSPLVNSVANNSADLIAPIVASSSDANSGGVNSSDPKLSGVNSSSAKSIRANSKSAKSSSAKSNGQTEEARQLKLLPPP